MAKLKTAQLKYDPDTYYSAADSISDRIFLCFPAGWIVGLIAGTTYAGFHWNELQAELGRTLLLTVTVALGVTYWLCCRVIRRIPIESVRPSPQKTEG